MPIQLIKDRQDLVKLLKSVLLRQYIIFICEGVYPLYIGFVTHEHWVLNAIFIFFYLFESLQSLFELA